MKRTVEICLTALLLVPACLFMALLCLAITAIDRFPPFFLQKRVGKNGREFTCCKLRTLKPADHDDDIGNREKVAQRMTWLGGVLRNHGWDELPQLLNILSGTMSFIGPRPLLKKTFSTIRQRNPELIDTLSAWETKRNTVSPGLTGWHQIHQVAGKSMIYSELDYFERRHSIIKIIVATVCIFFCGKTFYSKYVTNKYIS